MFNKLKEWNDKKIAILGLGIENLALVKILLKKNIKCEIIIYDRRKKLALGDKYKSLKGKVNWKLEKEYKEGISGEILFRSPGWSLDCPYIKKAVKHGARLSSPMQLFLELCPTSNIVGVTGTKGKGTTASLIHHILKTAGKKSWLGGNIGIAPFGFIEKIKQSDWVVLELSSFQLEDMTISPQIAVITNFTPEHLSAADPNNPNYHASLKEYWAAKSKIFKFQNLKDLLVINKSMVSSSPPKLRRGGVRSVEVCPTTPIPFLSREGNKVKELCCNSKIIIFTKSDLKSKLAGEHNRENVAAAVAVAKEIGISKITIRQAIAGFKGLEHRLEPVRMLEEVKYYNDSFATTPEATITALKSFNEPIVLLCGGAEKKSDFKRLAKEIKKRVKFVVLLDGEATKRLRQELINAGLKARDTQSVDNIKKAVILARKNAGKGSVVLLSTACASFGMFKNYKERGEFFKSEVQRLQ